VRPAVQDIEIYRGDAFSFFFRVAMYDPVTKAKTGYEDLSGWTGVAQIRASRDAASPLASFVVTFANQASYTGGVLLTLSSTTTSALNLGNNIDSGVIGSWDVQLTNTLGEPNTFIQGSVTLTKDVTH
jgi:hypothetical protein